MKQNTESNMARNERAFRSISYVLMFLMFTCAAMAMGGVIYNFAPGWHSSVIAGILLLVVIDRLFTYPRFRSLQFLSAEWATTLGTHWIVFILFIRLLLSYVNGSKAFVRDLGLFARGDWVSFFSPDFVLTLILAVLAWFIPAQVLQVLDEIGLDPRLALREDSGVIREAIPVHQRLVNWIFSIGIVLVLLAAMARLNLHATFSNPNGFSIVLLDRFSAAEAGVLFYFIFGLALLSVSRLMSLQTRWNRQRIPISSDTLVRKWGVYSLVFLLLLALLISLLPAGKGLGFLSLVGILLSFLISVFAFIAGVIVALILFLITLPFVLFGKSPPIANSSAPPLVLPTMPAGPALPPTSSAIWEVVRSILLWGSIILIIVFSLVRFLRQHEGLSSSIRKARLTTWLMLAWQWLRKNLEQTRKSVSHTLTDGWQRVVARLGGKRALPPAAFISLRSLDPRRRVYFFYLAMIRRGGEQGLRRKLSQTPSEYAAKLEQALPAASEDVDSITDAFVEARYSHKEVDSNKADFAKAAWGRIRRALQSASKTESSVKK